MALITLEILKKERPDLYEMCKFLEYYPVLSDKLIDLYIRDLDLFYYIDTQCKAELEEAGKSDDPLALPNLYKSYMKKFRESNILWSSKYPSEHVGNHPWEYNSNDVID